MRNLLGILLIAAVFICGCWDSNADPRQDNSVGKMISLNEAVGFWGHPRTPEVLMRYLTWTNDPPDKKKREEYLQELVQRVQVAVNGQVVLAQQMQEWKTRVDLHDYIAELQAENNCFEAKQLEKSLDTTFRDWKEWRYKNHKLPEKKQNSTAPQPEPDKGKNIDSPSPKKGEKTSAELSPEKDETLVEPPSAENDGQ